MNSNDLRKFFPSASIDFLNLNSGKTAEPQRADRKGELALAPKVERGCSERVHIRFTSVRKRLLDPDNIVCKWTLDCLRYGGIIRGDEPDKITLETRQRKVEKGEQEKTIVEVFSN